MLVVEFIFLLDIYVSVLSNQHKVAAKGWFIAVVSTIVATNDPQSEIQPGLRLLGPIAQK
jgi:Rab GDP dissociation inhibitor